MSSPETRIPHSRDFTRAVEVTPEVEASIQWAFQYHQWDDAQKAASSNVRRALAAAMAIIVNNVPPCPDRTVAIRKIREACMDCNQGITFRGEL